MFAVGEQARAGGSEDEARAIYLEGHAAAARGRWSVALERFREGYRLSRNAAALFNIGAALLAANVNGDGAVTDADGTHLENGMPLHCALP